MLVFKRPRRINAPIGTTLVLAIVLAATTMLWLLTSTFGAQAASTCPCSLFDEQTLPASASAYNDNTTQTLGVRFQPEIDGFVTGMRFYLAPDATGTHIGTLWDAYGNSLASGTFPIVGTSGWQTLMFATPVPVTANTTYTVSYTVDDNYMASGGYFTETPYENFPLKTLATTAYDAVGDRGNGVFKLGNNVYPTDSFNGGNYWADPIFVSADSTTPQVVATSPNESSTNVGIGTSITASFTTYLDKSSLTSSTITVKDSHGAIVPSSISYDASTKMITITTDAPLALKSTYTVTLGGGSGGIQSLDAVPLASDYSWSFTTEATSSCPCTAYGGVGLPASARGTIGDDPVMLGVQIQPDEDGYIIGMRHFHQMLDTGTSHTIGLYTTSKTLLGTGFTSVETATGWQTIMFNSPIAVTRGTTYVLAMSMPGGNYVYSRDLTAMIGNGEVHVLGNSSTYVYTSTLQFPDQKPVNNTNYYLDPIFSETPDTTLKLKVQSSQPTDTSYGVDTHKPISLTFSAALDASTTDGSLSLQDASGQSVSGTTTYDSSTNQLTFTPDSQLAYSTTYTLRVSSSLKDIYGATFDGGSYSLSFTTGVAATTTLTDGKGGPILVVTSSSDTYSPYLAEILRAEGINYFDVKDIDQLDGSLLDGYRYILLGSVALSSTQRSDLETWVKAGGNLIAFKPDSSLGSLLGITDTGTTLSEGYLAIDTSSAPGSGLVSDTIQYHSDAERYVLAGATSVATLYSDATTATLNPAVTTRSVGKGNAAAFAYDLPESIVLTHQGNPAWINRTPYLGTDNTIRPDDLFHYGSSQADWINLEKARIPQADVQQRLLVNMLTSMSSTSTQTGPAPHYWYLPHGYKAALEMTSDDHSVDRTPQFFNQVGLESGDTCSVIDWTCDRAGSLVFTSNSPTVAQATLFNKHQFPMGVHVNTGCGNPTHTDMINAFSNQLTDFAAHYPNLPPQQFGRIHCYVWNNWVDVPKVDTMFGIRYTMEYEWYPPKWTGTYTGLLTGSAQVMRFADTDGTILDVYNAPTDLDYETDPSSVTMDADLAGATGPDGFYGIYGTHYDYSNSYQDLLQEAAAQYGVPMISAEQALTWKDAHSNSTFDIISSTPKKVVFRTEVAEGGEGMVAMLPDASSDGALSSLTVGGKNVSYTTATIKGISYITFDAAPGTYTATYGVDKPVDNGNNTSSSVHEVTNSGSDTAEYATIFDDGTSGATSATDNDSGTAHDTDASADATSAASSRSFDAPKAEDSTKANTSAFTPIAKVSIGVAILAVIGGGGWWFFGIVRRRGSSE